MTSTSWRSSWRRAAMPSCSRSSAARGGSARLRGCRQGRMGREDADRSAGRAWRPSRPAATPMRAGVCVVGASYGGYAALAGAALHPEAYRSRRRDRRHLRPRPLPGGSQAPLRRRFRPGSRSGGASWAMRRTPSSRHLAGEADRQRPGADAADPWRQDTVVPIEQSQLMANAMKAAGKPVEFVTLANENHYLTKAATRTQTPGSAPGLPGEEPARHALRPRALQQVPLRRAGP